MRRLTPLALLAAIAGLLIAILSPAGPASAHADLATSAPADGAVLDQAPEALILTFTERVELRATTVDIVDGDGRRYAPASLTLHTSPDAGDPDSTETPVSVAVGLAHLPANVYHIRWRTLSSDDLHATSGNLVFGVQRTVTAADAAAPAGPAPAEALLRGLGVLGLSVLMGGALLAALARTAGAMRRRLRVVAASGGVLAAVAAPIQLYAQVSLGGTASGGLLLSQATSMRWLAYEVGLVGLTAAMLARSSLRTVAAVAVPSAVSAAVGAALLGHAAAGSPLIVVTTAVHILAAAGWAGSVVAAAIVLVGLRRSTGSWRPDAVSLLRAFGVVAAASVAALAISGLLMAGRQIATVDGLLTTPYGLLLLGKLAVSAAAGALGLRTAHRLRAGRPGPGLPIRGLVTEAVALIAVLGLAGALASAAPANGPRFQAAGVTTAPQASGQVADLVDAVAVRPNVPGRNVISMTVSDTRRPALAPVTGVSVTLISPDGTRTVHPVTRTADGSWALTTDDIRTAGRWRIAVTVLRPGMAAATDEHDWGVAGGAARVVVSAAPLRRPMTILAGVVAMLVMALAYRAVRRARRHVATAAAAAVGESPEPATQEGHRPAPLPTDVDGVPV